MPIYMTSILSLRVAVFGHSVLVSLPPHLDIRLEEACRSPENYLAQNRLKVGPDKPKLKVKMQSVSDDDVRKRLLEKPRFELAAKDIFRLGRRCQLFHLATVL